MNVRLDHIRILLTICVSTRHIGAYSGEGDLRAFKSLLPLVDPNDVILGGWDISSMNLADAMARARVLGIDLQKQLFPTSISSDSNSLDQSVEGLYICVLGIDLQKQLRPYMQDMVLLLGVYYPDFIAANQGARADNYIKGTKLEQLEQLRKDISVGLNDTKENLFASLEKNGSKISSSTLLYAWPASMRRLHSIMEALKTPSSLMFKTPSFGNFSLYLIIRLGLHL
ncbi:hypothetical protein R1sor_005876 [Riccia sorocarpa]|uniref:3'-5' exonuclease domain-containing protein n=1 Tax=Riccia sorocarpa TaxID=122646 RepID=A0ABD3HQ69_9MARC